MNFFGAQPVSPKPASYQRTSRFLALGVSAMLFVVACKAPVVTPTPSPSQTSTAAFMACKAILSETAGYLPWIQRANALVPANINEFSGVAFSERLKGYQLLTLEADFADVKEAILARGADIRQQGPGCIETVDSLFTFARGLEILAIQSMMCALADKQGTLWTGGPACTEVFTYTNANNRLAAKIAPGVAFADPTPEYLQALQAWPKELGVGSNTDVRYSNDSEANVCNAWTGAFEVSPSTLRSYMEAVIAIAYPTEIPELPAESLPMTTKKLYFGTASEKKELISAVNSIMDFQGGAPLLSVRAISGNSLDYLGINTLCAAVAAQVDLIGRAPTDDTAKWSKGLYGVLMSGLARCDKGDFGSDLRACYMSRVWTIAPKLIDALWIMNDELGKTSNFRLVSEFK